MILFEIGGEMINYLRRRLLYSADSVTRQFTKYLVVGGLAAAADITVYNIGILYLQVNHIVSNSASFLIGLLINYFLSREWVFNKKEHNFK